MIKTVEGPSKSNAWSTSEDAAVMVTYAGPSYDVSSCIINRCANSRDLCSLNTVWSVLANLVRATVAISGVYPKLNALKDT